MNLTEHYRLLQSRLHVCLAYRSFVTSSIACGRKNRIFQTKEAQFIKIDRKPHPFDERFYISAKDVSRHKPHGSVWAEEYAEKNYEYAPQLPGYKLKVNKHFKVVKEMIPEFIVPDLEGFELKPYVTYNLDKLVTQSEFTAQDLFDATYGTEVVEKFKSKASELDKVTPEELLDQSSFTPKT